MPAPAPTAPASLVGYEALGNAWSLKIPSHLFDRRPRRRGNPRLHLSAVHGGARRTPAHALGRWDHSRRLRRRLRLLLLVLLVLLLLLRLQLLLLLLGRVHRVVRALQLRAQQHLALRRLLGRDDDAQARLSQHRPGELLHRGAGASHPVYLLRHHRRRGQRCGLRRLARRMRPRHGRHRVCLLGEMMMMLRPSAVNTGRFDAYSS
jgi:hypothetical protein